MKGFFWDATAKRWDAVFKAGLLIFGVFGILVAGDYGTTWDEAWLHDYGVAVVDWYLSGFENGRALATDWNLYLYGAAFEAPVGYLASLSEDPYLIRHLATFGCFILILLYLFRLGKLLDSARAGVFAALFMASYPLFFGHSFINSKDIPFATAVVAGWYYFFRGTTQGFTWRTALLLGVCGGLAMGIRVIAFIPIAMWGGWYLVVRLLQYFRRVEYPAPAFRAELIRLSLAGLLGWAVMLVFWPWALQSPLIRPFSVLVEMTKFEWDGVVLVNGVTERAKDLPPSYVWNWLRMTLPGHIALGCLSYPIIELIRRGRPSGERRRWLEPLMLLSWVIAPVALVIVRQAVLYDGLRHLLFALAVLPLLAGLAVSRALSWERPIVRPAMVIPLFVGLLLLTVWRMAVVHPYEYTFFNRVGNWGGDRGALRFETDYWGTSYREALLRLAQHLKPFPDARRVRVANGSTPTLTSYYIERYSELSDRMIPVALDEDPDYLLAIRRKQPDITGYRTIDVVSRDGTIFCFILKREKERDTGGAFQPLLPGEDLVKDRPELFSECLHGETGWSVPEGWGAWVVGSPAKLKIPFSGRPLGGATVELELHGFVHPNHPIQRASVFLNNRKLGDVELTLQSPERRFSFISPPDITTETGGAVLELRCEDLRSPASVSDSGDTRSLGLGLKGFLILP